MALRLEIPRHVQEKAGFRSKSPLSDILEARNAAAFSPDCDKRHRALSGLHDLDSLSSVADRTAFPDTKAEAVRALEWRMRSFTLEVVSSISSRTDSPSIKGCAERITRRG